MVLQWVVQGDQIKMPNKSDKLDFVTFWSDKETNC